MTPNGPLQTPEFAPVDLPNDVLVTSMKSRGVVSQPEDKQQTRAKKRDLPFLMDGDMLQVQNDEKVPVDFEWGRKHYTIEAGQAGFVIFEALVDKLGDPRSMESEHQRYDDGNGQFGIIMDRHFELTRLFARYAVFNEQLEDTKDKEGRPVFGLLSKVPKVRVATLSGQPVFFPCQRPDMLPFPVPLVDSRAVNTDTVKVMDQIAAENADLRASLEQMEQRMTGMYQRLEELLPSPGE